MLRHRLNVPSGFTLVEMVVVLFVISVVLMIALPDLRQTGVKAQSTTCEANQRLIRTQLENYYLDHQYRYPLQEQSSPASAQILQQLHTERYLETVPVCPTGGDYVITYSKNADVSSSKKVICTVHGELGTEPGEANETGNH